MKIISWNVNGIRAVERKGNLQEFLQEHNPDIFLIQEIKGTTDKFSKYLTENEWFHQEYNSAEKPGYAGTGIWIKKELGLDYEFQKGMKYYNDHEGRVSRINFQKEGKSFVLFGIYFPNGGKSPEAWQDKLVFYDAFLKNINELRDEGKTVIWSGDVNCAHHEIDLARPKENVNSIGFLPEERAWIDEVIESQWTDVFRETYPEKVIYSWWHQITRSRSKNIGWRIDYFFTDKGFFSRVKNIEYLNEQMGSDHCPILLEF